MADYPNLSGIPNPMAGAQAGAQAVGNTFDGAINAILGRQQLDTTAYQQALKAFYDRQTFAQNYGTDPQSSPSYPQAPDWYPQGVGQGPGPWAQPGQASSQPPVRGIGGIPGQTSQGPVGGSYLNGGPIGTPGTPTNPGSEAANPSLGSSMAGAMPGAMPSTPQAGMSPDRPSVFATPGAINSPQDHFQGFMNWWQNRQGYPTDPVMRSAADVGGMSRFIGNQQASVKMQQDQAAAFKDYGQGKEALSNANMQDSLFGGGVAPGDSQNTPTAGVPGKSAVQLDAEAILAGTKAPSQIASVRGKPYAAAVGMAVNRLNPNFDWQQAEANLSGKKELADYQNSAAVQTPARMAKSASDAIDSLLAISDDFSRTNARFLNTPIMKFNSQTGTQALNLKFALSETKAQIGQVMQAGGVPREEVIKKLDDSIPDNITAPQLAGLAPVMKQFLAMRAKGIMSPVSQQDISNISSQPAKAPPAGSRTAINRQTGERQYWNGLAWVPVK